MRSKFYITTPVYYVNDKPHLGHAYTDVAADAIARWRRFQGDKVLFLTGTDEHGTKNLRSAEEAGQDIQTFVGEAAAKFSALKEVLNLSWDRFIRTSDQKMHWPGAQDLWRKLEDGGDLYWKDYEGLYCVGCEMFLIERDLVGGLCPTHKQKPELVREKNLFFRLSRYRERVRRAIESGSLEICPETRQNEILALLKRGLEDVSFSRPKEKLGWGIPVPGHDDQVMYVWCDALSNYVTAVGYGRDGKEFKKWWPAEIHVIGKDILRFHAAIWPAMLLSAGLALPKRIYVHGFITADGEKMSKSLGNVVDPVAVAKKYGSDAVRYYLLREIPSDGDGDFNQRRFEECYNADLANGLGNFASRVTTLAQRAGDLGKSKVSREVRVQIDNTAALVRNDIERFKLHTAVARVWGLIKFGDGYINDHKPWETQDKTVIANALYLLGAIARLVEPITPGAAARITAAIRTVGGKPAGAQKIENLFPRLDA